MNRRRGLSICLKMLTFLMVLAPAAMGKTIYVDVDADVDADGVNDGSSWQDAYIRNVLRI